MENYIVKGVADNFYIPSVNFNADSGSLEIEGESYLEDTKSFYEPILDWLKKFVSSFSNQIIFNIKLTYYNTSSSRSILEMLYVLKSFKENGGDLQVNWYYDEDDLDVPEEVEDFEIDTGLEIKLIPVEDL